MAAVAAASAQRGATLPVEKEIDPIEKRVQERIQQLFQSMSQHMACAFHHPVHPALLQAYSERINSLIEQATRGAKEGDQICFIGAAGPEQSAIQKLSKGQKIVCVDGSRSFYEESFRSNSNVRFTHHIFGRDLFEGVYRAAFEVDASLESASEDERIGAFFDRMRQFCFYYSKKPQKGDFEALEPCKAIICLNVFSEISGYFRSLLVKLAHSFADGKENFDRLLEQNVKLKKQHDAFIYEILPRLGSAIRECHMEGLVARAAQMKASLLLSDTTERFCFDRDSPEKLSVDVDFGTTILRDLELRLNRAVGAEPTERLLWPPLRGMEYNGKPVGYRVLAYLKLSREEEGKE